jgi:hypothetical protein
MAAAYPVWSPDGRFLVKPTLLKPGAERLCTLFGLSPELHEVAAIEDWDGTGEGHGEPLFYYRYKVRLVKNGITMGEGVGGCSSRESRYRWRLAERKCPKCGKQAIIKGRQEYGAGWLCFGKRGGCGAKFKDGDSVIEGQAAGRVLNPDAADITNTILKMACKRALVAATLIATNASEFYTQDTEDLEVIDVSPAEPPREADPPSPKQTKPPQANQEAPPRPWNNFSGMVSEFAKLRGRLGPDLAFTARYCASLTSRIATNFAITPRRPPPIANCAARSSRSKRRTSRMPRPQATTSRQPREQTRQ